LVALTMIMKRMARILSLVGAADGGPYLYDEPPPVKSTWRAAFLRRV
jgi:hypothetical protein